MTLPNQTLTPHLIDLTGNSIAITSGNLELGGRNPSGETIEFTNYYMARNGQPCIPVMGEFHFTRYAQADWEEELLKMKAGGIDTVATYVFWIHIEGEEGVFNWSGNNSLRRFVELCRAHRLQVVARIGPFAHGECRNGGLPDWLYGRPFAVRSNDERYLSYVRRLYGEIAAQLEGLLFKDGGPVIGIQLENEYMHAGAPWEVTYRQGTEFVPAGSEGVEHLITLKRLAVEAGLEVPIYSCTAWLNSPIIEGETLPMQGGYIFTPWNPDPHFQQPPTREFLFRNRHLDPVINGKPTYEASKYPYACCEIGAGIQNTYFHRDVVPPEAVEALAVMNLAGGANFLGYYMYHGGSHPHGDHTFMNEYTVPRISYDFQAPIREFGQVAESYHYLRLLHTFLNDFGPALAPMSVVLPDDAAGVTPENTAALRYAARSSSGAGFLFLNNFQDHLNMADIPDIRFQLRTAEELISLPYTQPLTLLRQVTAILPFGLSLEGVRLKYATVQLLAKIEEDDAVNYFFFAPRGLFSEYAFDCETYHSLSVSRGELIDQEGLTYVTVKPDTDCVITLTTASGQTVRLFTLTRDQAERSCKKKLWGQERLLISEAIVVPEGDNCALYSLGKAAVSVSIYPPVEGHLAIEGGICTEAADGYFTCYTVQTQEKAIRLQVERSGDDQATVTFTPDILDGVHDVLLRIDYQGDIGNAFIDGLLVHDNFYNGTTWEIGLRHFAPAIIEKEIFIKITPLGKNGGGVRYVPTGMAFRPESDEPYLASIHQITAVPEYKITLRFQP